MMPTWSSPSSPFVTKPAVELGWSIVNDIIETSTKCTGGKEKMILAPYLRIRRSAWRRWYFCGILKDQ